MSFDNLFIYASLVAAVISLFAFTYSSVTARFGFPNVTGKWDLSLSQGGSTTYDIVKGNLIIKRQFLGELHGVIETEYSLSEFKGSINRQGMILGVVSAGYSKNSDSPTISTSNLMLLLRPDGTGADGQYMTARSGGSINQGHIILERAANKSSKKDAGNRASS
jgi:hypothetical protein